VPNTWTSLRTKGEVSKDRSSIIHIDENAFDPMVGSLGGGSTNLILGDLRSDTVGYFAEKHFTDDTSRLVQQLLSNDKAYNVSDAALFADISSLAAPPRLGGISQ
jgi:hypothetical protein